MRNVAGTKFRFSFIKIFEGSDLSRRRIPRMTARAPEAGPVLWLAACGHGDEVGGIVVIQEIFKRIRRTGLVRGTLHAFPMMNPLGFETSSREIVLSREDLNRSFPGDENGTLAQRIAARLFETILETEPAAVLDLHNDWIRSIPYALLDAAHPSIREDVMDRAVGLAKRSGFQPVRDAEPLPATLSFSLLKAGVPALTLELGESYVVNERNIDFGVRSVLNVLADFGMVAPLDELFFYAVPPVCADRILAYTDRPYTSTSGIVRFLARPGEMVAAGRPIARIANAFGKVQETLKARAEGLVLGHADYSVGFPGRPVMSFGLIPPAGASA